MSHLNILSYLCNSKLPYYAKLADCASYKKNKISINKIV